MSSLEDKIEVYKYQAKQPAYYLLETRQDPLPWDPAGLSNVLKNHNKQLKAINLMKKSNICDSDEYISYFCLCMDLFGKKMDKFRAPQHLQFRVTEKAIGLHKKISPLLPNHETIVHRDVIEYGEIVFISPNFTDEDGSYENFVMNVDELTYDRDMSKVVLTIIAENYPDDTITKLPFEEMIERELADRPNWFKEVNIL